jgi:hypothetical protein
MLKFLDFITERFVNLIDNEEEKHKHKHEVFDLLQKSYAKIGGIHGSGFESPDHMVKKIPFWKLSKKDGKVVAAKLYKDKGGRKAVAMGTNGTDEGKKAMGNILKDDITKRRGWGEVSGSALSFAKKQVPDLHKHAIPKEHVKKLMPDEEIRDAPHDDPEVQRHPELKDHFYQRKIGSDWHTKVAWGSPGKTIK